MARDSRRLHRQRAIVAALALLAAAPALGDAGARHAGLGIVVPDTVLLPGGVVYVGDYSGSGDADERPVHRHRVGRLGFGRTEVTRRQWAPFAVARGYAIAGLAGASARLPVVNVAYGDAVDYARWLSSRTGDRWRLPTEAEWEYAARAGSRTLFHNGNDPDSLCAAGNIADTLALAANPRWETTACADGYAGLAPAGSFAPNAFGLHDLHGNVWEWVDGCGGESRPRCERRNVRGGSYQTPAWSSRSSNRETLHRHTRRPDLGFRLVKD